MINRAAVLLKYKQPAVAWINEADPVEPMDLSVDQANQDRNVYLVSDRDADSGAIDDWVDENWAVLFDIELEGWHEDERLWPPKRDLELFHAWFEVEIHTMLHDTVDGPIFDQDD